MVTTADLADLEERAATYAQIIEEGSASDIAIWIDPDALEGLWRQRHSRPPQTSSSSSSSQS